MRDVKEEVNRAKFLRKLIKILILWKYDKWIADVYDPIWRNFPDENYGKSSENFNSFIDILKWQKNGMHSYIIIAKSFLVSIPPALIALFSTSIAIYFLTNDPYILFGQTIMLIILAFILYAGVLLLTRFQVEAERMEDLIKGPLGEYQDGMGETKFRGMYQKLKNHCIKMGYDAHS